MERYKILKNKQEWINYSSVHGLNIIPNEYPCIVVRCYISDDVEFIIFYMSDIEKIFKELIDNSKQ